MSKPAPSLKDGFLALNRGDLAVAGEACKRALNDNPESVQAHFLVGLVALEGQQRQIAHEAFKSVIKLDRDHAAAWVHLAKLNVGEGRIKAAEAALKEVRRIQPSDPVVIEMMGTVLNQLGEYETAEVFFHRATQLAPQNPSALVNLANAKVFLGQIDDAVALFKRAIAIDPTNAQSHWGLANSVKATDRDHIEQMKALLAKGNQPQRAQGFLNYAIGKACEDLKEWDEAFEAFSAGAAARRETVEFDEQAEADMFESVKTLFTARWLSEQAEGAQDPAPIFVLGQPRTGTTLIERIITSHSAVHSAGELQQFGLSVRRAVQHPDPRRFSSELFAAAAKANPKQIGEMYLRATARQRGKQPFFVDKLPINYLNIPLILAALPNAKIVHLIRGPMDACFASYKQLFADAYLHSYEQGEMARHHVRYRDLMAHFREEFPNRIIDISYEATASDLEPNARALIAALNLDWEDACLNFYESSSGIATASSVQVREPAHTRSIGRWRRYEAQLKPMTAELEARGIALD